MDEHPQGTVRTEDAPEQEADAAPAEEATRTEAPEGSPPAVEEAPGETEVAFETVTPADDWTGAPGETESAEVVAVHAVEAEAEADEELMEEGTAEELEAETAEELAAEEAQAEPAPEEPQAEPTPELTSAAGGDPFKGLGDWYVVHTYAGYENKVKANLESRIHTMQMEDKIFQVHIPMEDVMEIKSGKKQVVQKKVFPGYLLVKMLYDNDSWYVVRNTPGVTGFVSAGTGSKPTPLSRREVEKILVVKKEEVKPTFRLEFEEGDVVRIISGPFADFNGTISEINVDQSKLKVLVNIFDRETPVELGFDQVAKV
jgi:transcriptional antiterminator NusG